jgi:pimeloyl-ACP methyl ester carboxylesterase
VSDATVVRDACRGILKQHGLTPSRIYAMGRSVGSAAAIEVAVARPGDQLSGLIVESGFADTFALLARLGVWLNGATEAADCFANADKISRVTIPTLVIHGQADVLIPAAEGEELSRRAGAKEKKLLLVSGAGHNDLLLVGRVEYFQAINEFVFGVQA